MTASELLWLLRKPTKLKYENYRSAFTDLPITEQKPVQNHTHPVEASTRSTAVVFFEKLARKLGMEYYSYQKSNSDTRRGNVGYREYYWLKDLTTKPEMTPLTDNHLIGMVDVDYYVDMPHYLAGLTQPVILYTFIPDEVCGNVNGASFTFNKDSEVEMVISGGANYQHKLWNYGVDNVFCWKSVRNGLVSTNYLVDRRCLGPHRYMVMLTPLASWGTIGTLLALCTSKFVKYNPLTRLQVCTGEFLKLYIKTKEALRVSIARVRSHVGCTIDAKDADLIETMARIGKVDISIPTVKSIVSDTHKAAVLVDYFRTEEITPADYVFPVDLGVRSYQVFSKEYDPDAKPAMKPFMSPIVHGCFSPDKSIGNERFSVDERVRKTASDVRMTPFLHKVINEFLELFIPVPYQHHPRDLDEVYERQNKPSQRQIIERASLMARAKRVVSSFLKAEAYGNIKPPRTISTINGVDKVDYSRYMYAFSDHLKTMPWYAFGHKPIDISVRVAEVCEYADHVIGTDLSRMDGRVSELLRELEEAATLRFFAKEYHDDLMDKQRSQIGLKAYTSSGVEYETGFSRLSGSPETSGFNTMDNAFINFLAFRMMKQDGQFMPPQEAWDSLGIYGGDDGLTADVDPKCLEKAAKMVGQVLTAEVVKSGELGVKFLARCYSRNVWYGSLDSCCDIARTLSKFHASPNLPEKIPHIVKLYEKIRSFAYTDLHTPVIGDLIKRWYDVELNGTPGGFVLHKTVREKYKGSLRILRPYIYSNTLEDNYCNEDSDWMFEVLERDLPGFDYDRFIDWLDSCESIYDFLEPPLCLEIIPPKTDIKVAVDGDVHGTTDFKPLSDSTDMKKKERVNKWKENRPPKPRQSSADGNWRKRGT